MTTTTPLEERLSAALTARADLVQPETLTPGTAPDVATVTPLRRHAREAGIVAAVAAAAVVAALLVTTKGDEPGRLDPPVASQSPSAPPTPNTTPTGPTGPTEPAGHGWRHGDLPSLEPAAVLRDLPFDEQRTFSDGSRARLTGTPEDARIEVTYRGETSTGSVPAAGNPPALVSTQLQLGQAGAGYLVRSEGGDVDQWTVFVPSGGALVPATVTGDAPFGGGFLDGGATSYQTWLGRGGNGIFTAVSTAQARPNHYTVYQWEVSGPGEGGGPDNPAVELVPTSLGEVCLDNATGEYGRC